MHSKTRIVVLHMKEVIYTGIFVLLGILFIIVMVIMFSSDKNNSKESADATGYIPGVYNTTLTLGESTIELEMVLDAENINSIRLVNMNESVTTMYPLIEPVLEKLTTQICEKQTLEGIVASDDMRYTQNVLMKAIETTLQKAQVQNAPSDNENALQKQTPLQDTQNEIF